MSYASQADMVDRFGEQEMISLTDRDRTGAINTEVLERALSDATAEIDSHLATRYELPLTSVPRVLVRLCADMARYYLHDDNLPETVAARHKASTELLRKVSSGQVSIGSGGMGDAPEATDGAEIVSGGRIWGRDDSKGYI